MHACAVIALVVVLEHHLPVRIDFVRDALHAPQIGQRIVPKPRGGIADLAGERMAASGGVARGEIQKEESAPRVDTHGVERQLLLVNTGALIEMRRRAERTFERVRPGVIGALDAAGKRAGELRCATRAVGAREHELASAVPAHIIVGAELALPCAHDEHALAGNIDHQVAAGYIDIFLAARVEPFANENVLLLSREDLGREVVLPREGPLHSLRHRDVGLGHAISDATELYAMGVSRPKMLHRASHRKSFP
jgi:hypothetical protein